MHARPRSRTHRLSDGRRLHLQDGPIDLVIEAFGTPAALEASYAAATTRFGTVLDELCAELSSLRKPGCDVSGCIARSMRRAVEAASPTGFITPMAAVAGAVADEILRAMLDAAGEDLRRAYVNNGGDIAIHLAAGETFTIGLIDRPDNPAIHARSRIASADGIGGIATSGAPGRSFSLGIADAVTVLAATAARADAAATVIANAVDLPGDPRITRVSASSLQPDSDLGERLVTRDVKQLDGRSIALAIESGCKAAQSLIARNLIAGAALHLQGTTRLCGSPRYLYLAEVATPPLG